MYADMEEATAAKRARLDDVVEPATVVEDDDGTKDEVDNEISSGEKLRTA